MRVFILLCRILICISYLFFSGDANAQSEQEISDFSEVNEKFGIEVRTGVSFFADTRLSVDGLEEVYGNGTRSAFDTSPGLLLEIAMTYIYNPQFTMEISMGRLKANLKDYSFSVGGRTVRPEVNGALGGLYGMAGIYYKLRLSKNTDRFAFIMGSGLGLMDTDIKAELDSMSVLTDSDIVLTYQLSSGISLDLNSVINLSTTYKYLAGRNPVFTTEAPDLGQAHIKFRTHNILLGFRMTY
ncbi:hypothetical protein GWK08_01180 [Leptobacterium flavescens]|uniref:Outer membrane beta-barrel protein n=1 Tax=Leptobacterium flavescens TaxID=472055 RepID=A0A6P0UHW6_9FLAO|nr:hypothetical protein [Leptobacterium flavescens]NER12040.1 hypothetical protein [Leptobacterium flavescens]